MAQLILIVVVVAWIAVLLPPMLRSRVENRPNSSVTDFRRQLTRLQHTATPPRGGVRAMGRPLAQSPLARPVAGGRPGQPTLRSGLTRHATSSELAAARNEPEFDPISGSVDVVDAPRFRSHGGHGGDQRRPVDRSGSHRRPSDVSDRYADDRFGDEPRPRRGVDRSDYEFGEQSDGRRRPGDSTDGLRRHSNATGPQRRPQERDRTDGQRRPGVDRDRTGQVRMQAKQRRMNIVFVLGITMVCSLFLAATTDSEFMVYTFALSFLAFAGYVWMLRQARLRDVAGDDDSWSDFR
jgi:hypothetical protein